MKSIKEPNIDSCKLYSDIVANKNIEIRKELKKCENDVFLQYEKYITNKSTLELMKPSKELSEHKDALLSCYGNNKHLNNAKKIIFEQTDKCPYCDINEANTLDHYLNKSEYPEYSVFVPNLIPCCSKCNTKKDILLTNNGTREFVHFYYDYIPESKFLYFRFNYDDEKTFKFDIFLDDSIVLKYPIIRQHFTNLDLVKRYKKDLNSKVTTIVEIIKSNKRSFSINEENVKEYIESMYFSFKKTKGENHIDTCLYEGFLNSGDFFHQLWQKL